MKLVGVVATVVVLASTAAVASAQPALVEPAAALPSTYLQLGLDAGVNHITHDDNSALFGAVALEGGYRLGTSNVWLHGMIEDGGLAQLFETNTSSTYLAARVGLEGRTCSRDGVACIVGGVDLGYHHDRFAGADEFRDDSVADELVHTDAFEVVPRLGVELGGRHLRMRAGIEGIAATDGLGVGMSLGLAYVL